jgi:hypothetical protein
MTRVKGTMVRLVPVLGSLVLFLGSLTACATTGGSTAQQPKDNPYAFIDEVKLEPGQVFYKDMVDSNGDTYSACAFEAANNFLAMDNFFEFTSKLSAEQQLELSRALFKNIPMRSDKGNLRIVMVGDYYGPDSDLIILIDRIGLKEGKVPGKSFGIGYFTNALNFKIENKDTKEKSLVSVGRNLNPTTNYYRIGIPYDEGRLVFSNNLTIKPSKLEDAKDDADLGNMMDTVVKDEFPDNDEMALSLYQQITSKSDIDPVIRVLAEMNYFLYQLRKNEFADAEKTLAGLPALVPPKADPSLQNAVAVEAPFLLKMMQAY